VLVVSDSGPLICFLDADATKLLLALYPIIIVPPAVHAEVFLRVRRVKPSGIKIKDIDDALALRRFSEFRQRLDLGEAQALALAEHMGVTVLMDERAGTLVAQEHGIESLTTIDLLRRLVAGHHLTRERARKFLETMRLNGAYLPDERFSA
jgi:predicted nucleic acid-binding protein